MNEKLNTYLYPVSLTILFAISCIISFKRKSENPKAKAFLSLMYWSYFYSLLVGYFNTTGIMHATPHLFRTGQATSLLFMPLSYLYVLHSLGPRKLKWKDLLHLLPLILYLADYSLFFLKPAAEKLAVYESVRGSRLLSDYGEGIFFPKGFHILMRYLVLLGYWIAQLICLRNAISKNSNPTQNYPPDLVGWLKWLTISELIIIIPPMTNLFFPFEQVRIINQFSGILASLIQGYFLLIKPTILYGWDLNSGLRIAPHQPNTIDLSPPTKSVSLAGNKQDGDTKKLELMSEVISKLESHFCKNKPYRRQGYSLHDLAKELGYSTHQLSYFINTHYHSNFYALINQYRINECIDKIKQHEYREKTLDAIAGESGFHSRATFINAFKSQTGLTPSAFIKELH